MKGYLVTPYLHGKDDFCIFTEETYGEDCQEAAIEYAQLTISELGMDMDPDGIISVSITARELTEKEIKQSRKQTRMQNEIA